jgi:hypothetical protein
MVNRVGLQRLPVDLAKESVVVLTIDTDWAPEPCLADTFSMLRQAEVPATIFATSDVDPDFLGGFDVGIHPNFQGPAQDTIAIKAELSRLTKQFPMATAVRSHALVWSSRHYNVLPEDFEQLRITSNYLMFRQPAIRPFVSQADTVELPIFWVDDLCVYLDDRIDVDANLALLEEPGLKVFAFHPFHVYINSQTRDHVAVARTAYHDPDRLRHHRCDGDGARTMFERLLSRIGELNITVANCLDVAKHMMPGTQCETTRTLV